MNKNDIAIRCNDCGSIWELDSQTENNTVKKMSLIGCPICNDSWDKLV